MNNIDYLVLLLRIHAQRSKSFTCTAVRAYKGKTVSPRYCRPFCEDLAALVCLCHVIPRSSISYRIISLSYPLQAKR